MWLPYRILNCGLDDVLLKSREAALRREGYDVTSESSPHAALRELQARPFDAVIVCHTIPLEQRSLLASASERCEAPCVLIYEPEGRIRPSTSTEMRELLWIIDLVVSENELSLSAEYSWN